jgi:sigma-B regulation protein RsbU (phosphoserine phosphatase)
MEEPAAAAMLEAINLSLSERPIEAQYISMIYAIWDDNQQTLQLANSGLPRPLHCRDGKVEEIQVTGLPMGLFANADYDELTVRARRGDFFLFFSDGILDATSSKGQMFGRHRLEEIMKTHCHASAAELVDAIFTAVSTHAEGVEAFDDQTIVALKIKGPASKK